MLWWKRKKSEKLIKLISRPLILTMLISSSVILFYPVNNISYMILLFSSFFSIFSNGSVLLYFFKNRNFISSASISHIGVAMMLIGILFSSGYSSIVSQNYTGLVWNNDFPDEVNQNNMLLFLNEKRKIGKYDVDYLGKRKQLKNYSGYINENYLEYIPLLNKHILKKDVDLNGNTIFENDTVEVENQDITYFELKFTNKRRGFDDDGYGDDEFNLFPKVQTDPNSDMIVFSPDIKNNFIEDLYVHVRTFPDPKQEIVWKEKDSIVVKIDETFFLNDYVSVLEKITTKNINNKNRFTVEASVNIMANNQEYIAKPVYIIEDNKVGLIPDIIDDLGIKIYLSEIIPDSQSFKITFQTTQKNWVIIEAVQKPLINLLWIGFFILLFGLFLSLNRTKR